MSCQHHRVRLACHCRWHGRSGFMSISWSSLDGSYGSALCSLNHRTAGVGDESIDSGKRERKAETPSQDDIKAGAHMRTADAVQVLGIQEAKLRTLSRSVGFKRWPGRKLSSVINQAKVLNTRLVWSICDWQRRFYVRNRTQCQVLNTEGDQRHRVSTPAQPRQCCKPSAAMKCRESCPVKACS